MESKSAFCRLALVKVLPEGVIYIRMNKVIPTPKQLSNLKDVIQELIGSGKHKFLIDISDSLPLMRQDRLLTDEALGECAEKIAFIHRTELGKMIARLFKNLSATSVPKEIFGSEDVAMNWLLEESPVLERN